MYHKYFFSENTISNTQHTAEQYKRKQNNFNMTTIPLYVPSSYLTPVCPVCLSTLKCKHTLHYQGMPHRHLRNGQSAVQLGSGSCPLDHEGVQCKICMVDARSDGESLQLSPKWAKSFTSLTRWKDQFKKQKVVVALAVLIVVVVVIMAALHSRYYIMSCGFFFFFPHLISAVADSKLRHS